MRKPTSHIPVPKVGEGKRGEQGYLGYLLRQAAAAYRLRVERALADIGVTPPQFSVLTMLANYPGVSNADLARLAVLTPQTVSVIIANLERGGSLTRHPHAVHGRIQHIDLNEKGKSQLVRCRKRVHAIERELVEGLSLDDTAVIRRWLVSVATAHEGEGAAKLRTGKAG
jgi:DNA-binding MarR family transcriptional regulator